MAPLVCPGCRGYPVNCSTVIISGSAGNAVNNVGEIYPHMFTESFTYRCHIGDHINVVIIIIVLEFIGDMVDFFDTFLYMAFIVIVQTQ